MVNKWVFRRDLKVTRDVIVRMCCGRVFQSRGAEQLKALSPMVDRRADGVDRRLAEEERRVREGVCI